MATARLDMRLDASIKSKAEKATALLGYKSLTEYIVTLVDENATQVIAEHEVMVLDADVFDTFWDACSKARKPNQALLDAAEYAQAQGFK
ncbi:MAG: DUF1778 domain-containing protein [Mariprofundaceae bacterium]|nr:DUF1778 domain-containing protein [Mariprofundaceae bacterium]